MCVWRGVEEETEMEGSSRGEQQNKQKYIVYWSSTFNQLITGCFMSKNKISVSHLKLKVKMF